MLHKSQSGLDDGISLPDSRLTICLFAAWVLIFSVLSRGVKSSGKAAYFLAIFPYIVLITILIKGLTLPGALNGIKYFITPQWEKLLDIHVSLDSSSLAIFVLKKKF